MSQCGVGKCVGGGFNGIGLSSEEPMVFIISEKSVVKPA